ncbi:MAG: SIS domain-containing protein [Bacteroidetes bacterium]|nr:SIS domain-containing protein [Bacteroidota bacterium]
MQIDIYNQFYSEYFQSQEFKDDFKESLKIIKASKNIFFIGNGGSMSICSHMYEDYAKIGGYRTYNFSDPSLITCFANDYGYENAMAKWLEIYMQEGDVLIAISSSGNSQNILNAAVKAKELGAEVITLSGFKTDNKLKIKGRVNFYLGIENYGVVECFHQVVLHAILDQIVKDRK